MITNGATSFDIELRRNAAFTLAYDLMEDGAVISLSGVTHSLVIRRKIDDTTLLTLDATPDVDDQIVFTVSPDDIADLPDKDMDYYIVETPGDQMIAYGTVKVVK